MKQVKTVAVRWTGDAEDLKELIGLPEGSCLRDESRGEHFCATLNGDCVIDTLPDSSELVVWTVKGYTRASVGDWIVINERGELFPIKHDDFVKTYNATEL